MPVNLPAGSDVIRLRRQIAQLDHELRRVSVALERALAERDRPQEEKDADDPRAGNGRTARARASCSTGSAGTSSATR